MAFKCEGINPTLREKFYKEEIDMRKIDPEKYSFLVTGIDKKDNWIRDYERNIISWFSPSMMAKRDGDYSERVWIKFLNLKGDNISFFGWSQGMLFIVMIGLYITGVRSLIIGYVIIWTLKVLF